MRTVVTAAICWFVSSLLVAQEPLDGRNGRQLLLENFRPQPTLQVPQTTVTKARFPVIDVHTHFRLKLRSTEQLDDFVKIMDRNNIAICVSLDGHLGDELSEHIQFLNKYPGRFAVLANIDWRGPGKADDPATWDCHRADFARRTAEQLKDAKKRGAVGLKIFKDFGLEIKNPDGSLVRVDDPRWEDIWTECGKLGLPILIHTADPVAFFQPIDETNERWEELHRHPDWSFHRPGYPTHRELVEQLMHVVAKHPKTTFIAAHMANCAEDLPALSKWLDQYPNLCLDFASRINELGRQPYTARKFLIRHQDRVLFGTDGPWPETRIRLYWRFLETLDENFPYSEKDFPPQGLWNIYGVGLPDDVLQKIYFGNALKLLPSLKVEHEKFAKGSGKE
jgi:predicted TIM-barrel fold metal-dependent hydrolase